MRLGTLVLLAFLPFTSSLASETVYLTSGFSLTVDSHTEADGRCVLYMGSGTIEYSASEIGRIVSIAEATSPPGGKPSTATFGRESETILNNAAQNEGVDEIFVRSVAKVESGWRQEAVSNKGALGLMQLMPGTAAEMGVDPRQADQNASGGVRYLRSLLERYYYNPVLALAAYNAGPGAVAKYAGLPPYYETRVYVVRVLKEYESQLKQAGFRPDGIRSAKSSTAPLLAAKTPNATN